MSRRPRFPIVGIGASAGGVEALQQLFGAMPAESGMALVVVTHLGPGRESDLPSILAHCTGMPILAARDGVMVEPGHAYILPNDGLLTIRGGRLELRPQDPAAARQRQPIDLFFGSLAQDRGECAVGIVLSGGGSDGTLGIKAIKEHGGLTLAQGYNATAPRFPSMPSSAISSGDVDLVLPVESIPERLAEFARGLDVLAPLTEEAPKAEAERIAIARLAICTTLRAGIGHDFSGYKPKTFLRRVQRRMQVLRLTELDGYVAHLSTHPEEVIALFRDLLIGVTGFFRDAGAFEALGARILPELLRGRGGDDVVRLWVPGCSTGEEAYSLAMLLLEATGGWPAAPRIQIFATDIDEAALQVARIGRYDTALLAGISAERRARFFVSDGDSHVVSKQLRELCVFSAHSLIRDPPFSRIDLISCRNLMIYLNATLQDRIIPMFHYALRPGGLLFLGASENLTRHDDLFAPEDKAHFIFRRRDHAATAGAPRMLPVAPDGHAWMRPRPARPARGANGADLRHGVESLLLEQFTPAHVVVDREGDVVLQSSRLGRYLEPAIGVPSRQLLAMARRGLRLDLRAALRDAMEKREKVQAPGIRIEIEDRVQSVDLTVAPLPGREGAEPLFLVVFADAVTAPGAALARPASGEFGAMAQIEQELRETREKLQSIVEEYETSVEELRSANEEMVSVNEELQSTNEELETAKEEQQSVNEELQTLNAELAGKVAELARANADLHNLFDSTQIATVFLDQHLVIRGFTPAATAIFNLIPSDRGRPLTDFANNLDNVDLRRETRRVLDGREVAERRVTARAQGVHYLMRILPYRTADGSMDGVVVTFFDVTKVVEAEVLSTLVHELNHRVRNVLQMVLAICAHSLRRAGSLTEFRAAFTGRIQALGRSHELVSRGGWTQVPLLDLVLKEVEPYVTGVDRVRTEGPAVRIKPKVALALGMVLHELATNAAKHGALSVDAGRVAVAWTVKDGAAGQILALTWRETGGPPILGPPTRRGFGSELIERQMKYDLGGAASLVFAPEGLEASLTLPLDAVEWFEPLPMV